MRIAIGAHLKVPAVKYGGIERIIWWLAKQLDQRGHEVTLLVAPGSECPFARVLPADPDRSICAQVPDDVDLLHSFNNEQENCSKPYLATFQCNAPAGWQFHPNTVFVSRNQAERHGGSVFVHNALDPDDYGKPDFQVPRKHLLFLAKAAWKVKNVQGAIEIARQSSKRLAVVGGNRLNFSMGFRLTLDTNVEFHGMLGGAEKNRVINDSSALLFPVVWHEPFGIALIEALYFGCPVFGTRWGSLPEIVLPAVGYLSNSHGDLVRELANLERYDRRACHAYVCDCFSASLMATRYLELYEQVLDGVSLHDAPPVKPDVVEPKRFRLVA